MDWFSSTDRHIVGTRFIRKQSTYSCDNEEFLTFSSIFIKIQSSIKKILEETLVSSVHLNFIHGEYDLKTHSCKFSPNFTQNHTITIIIIYILEWFLFQNINHILKRQGITVLGRRIVDDFFSTVPGLNFKYKNNYFESSRNIFYNCTFLSCRIRKMFGLYFFTIYSLSLLSFLCEGRTIYIIFFIKSLLFYIFFQAVHSLIICFSHNYTHMYLKRFLNSKK